MDYLTKLSPLPGWVGKSFGWCGHLDLSVGHDVVMSNRNKGVLLVVVQFLLLFTIVVLPHDEMWPVSETLGTIAVLILIAGLAITLFGIVSLGSSLTATPVPKDGAVLRTTGMYAIVRHPIYLGLILFGLGLTLPSGSVLTVFSYGLLIFLLSYKARFEEQLLIAQYPQYRAYASRVGRILPFVGKLH